MKTAAIYIRVSTGSQNIDNQRLELEKVAEKSGWKIVQVYEESGISGAKSRDQRPGLNDLMKAATKRKFDMVMVWSVECLGRSLQDLVSIMNKLNSVGVDMCLHQQAIDTATPSGRALFQMCGVLAEFERAMIVERVKAGLSRAKSQNKVLGRPKTSSTIENQIRALRADGLGILKIAKQLGVGTSVVQRILKEEHATV